MRKIGKIVGILTLIFAVIITPFYAVKGFDIKLNAEAVKNEEWEATNPLAWVQTTEPSVAVPRSMNSVEMEGVMAKKTLGSSGCTYFAHLAMLIRAGVWDTKKDGVITDFYNLCMQKGMNKEEDFDGMFYWQGMNKYFPKVDIVKANLTNPPYNKVSELENFVKEAYDRGDFVVAYLQTITGNPDSGHAIFLEEVNSDGSLYVFDSSSPGSVLGATDTVFEGIMNDMGGRDSAIVYAMFEYSVEGVDSRDTIPLTERFAGSLDADKGVLKDEKDRKNKEGKSTEEANKEKEQLKTEYDSIDWRPSALLLSQHNMDMTWFQDKLSMQEKINMENLKQNIEADSFDFVKFVKQATVMAGLMLCVYGLLLIVAQVMDMVNPFLNISLVRTFTFGRFTIQPKGDSSKDNANRRRYISVFKYYVYVALMMGLGMAVATGRVQELVYTLIDLIKQFIG